MDIPISNEVVVAFGRFFHGGRGPSHSELTQVFQSSDCSSLDPYNEVQRTPNKQRRILAVGNALLQNKEKKKASEFASKLLDALRIYGAFSHNVEKECVDALCAAFRNLRWELNQEGRLAFIGGIDLETGGRQALDEQLRRLQQNLEDPAVLLGVAKDLIEAIGKFVLEEMERLPQGKLSFRGVLALSFEQLRLRPQDADTDAPGGKQLREIRQHANAIAGNINELRNLQGTGHGRTLPTGVSAEEARYVIRQATILAELMLSTHDRQMGRA